MRFKQADLRSLVLPVPCAVATACADVVNHLPSVTQVRRVLARVGNVLVPGGLFAFDTLRRLCFERYWAERTYYMESSGGDLVMECDWNAQKRVGVARVVAYERRGNNAFRKSTTRLVERFYSDAEIRDALRGAGFKQIKREPWDPWHQNGSIRPVLDRNFWTAVKS